MKVKIKKITPYAVIPKYSKEGDAGLDLVATSFNNSDKYVEFGTGLSIQIPNGFVGLIYPRSSISNTSNWMANSVGVIDSGYVGEIKVRFKGFYKNDWDLLSSEMHVGDKIAQLIIMPYPQIEFEEVEELESTERGNGGFGSTGK